MRVLDLFSGIGGFSLGLERAGMKTVGFVENEPFCQRVLQKHWPDIPIHGDVTTREFHEGEADVICGGFPCQDLSHAGRGAGLSGERSGLYRELVRAIRVVRPKFALVENVAALLGRGLGTVLGDLAESGYDAEWDCVPAAAVGAPHARDRIFIVAHPSEGEQPRGHISPLRRRQPPSQEGARIGAAADANRIRQLEPGWPFREIRGRFVYRGTGSGEWRTHWLDRLGALRGMDDGVSRRLDEAQPLGNAVVPQIPEIIGRAILAAEASP